MTLPENRKRFEKLIKDWIVLEDDTINNANDLIDSSKNPLLKAVIQMIKMDSEKHRHILGVIKNSIEHAHIFTTDDLKVVDTFLEKHIMYEKDAIETAEQAVEMSSLPIPKMLLSHLLKDDKGHDAYMEELNELKGFMAKDT